MPKTTGKQWIFADHSGVQALFNPTAETDQRVAVVGDRINIQMTLPGMPGNSGYQSGIVDLKQLVGNQFPVGLVFRTTLAVEAPVLPGSALHLFWLPLTNTGVRPFNIGDTEGEWQLISDPDDPANNSPQVIFNLYRDASFVQEFPYPDTQKLGSPVPDGSAVGEVLLGAIAFPVDAEFGVLLAYNRGGSRIHPTDPNTHITLTQFDTE